MKRRALFKAGAGVTLSAVIPAALAGTEVKSGSLLVREVRDDAAAPLLDAGQLLVIDSQSKSWCGEGLYLYPAWGQPRAWHVSRKNGQLQFSMPGQGKVLWTQPATTAFAGQVLGVLDPDSLAGSGLAWQRLELPVLPA